MYLAFYKATNDDLKGRLINRLSGNYGYSHVELVFSDGMSFSSSPRDGGVRFKAIEFNPDRWVFFRLRYTPKHEAIIRARARSIEGAEYDWLGIFCHQLLPVGVQNDSKWWCSEAIQWALYEFPFRISPNVMAKLYGAPGAS